MKISEYLQFVATRIEKVEEENDKEEAVRLLKVTINALQDTIIKILRQGDVL